MSTIITNELQGLEMHNREMKTDSESHLNINGTMSMGSGGILAIPRGPTSTRPPIPSAGMIRYNTQLRGVEVYDGSKWLCYTTASNADGSTEGQAAQSARALWENGIVTSGKGTRWIRTTNGPKEVYCDFDTLDQNGKSGWMMVGAFDQGRYWGGKSSDVTTTDELIDSSIQWYQTQTEDNQLIQAGILAIALTLCYLVFAMISIISSLLKYHPYTLTLSGLTLHRAGGLIAKQNDALKLGRIQVVRFSQPLLARFLKLWTLSFKQVQGHEVESRGQHMLIPSMKRQEIGTLLPKLQGLASGSTELPHKFTGINIIWFWRRASFVPPIALILGIVFHDTVMTLLLLITSLIAIISIYLRYRQWGYVIDDKDIWIHSGFLGHTWHCIPMIKVQHVALIQTHGQKKRSLANIEIGLASGLLTIPSIDESIASQLSERILNTISLDHHNWI